MMYQIKCEDVISADLLTAKEVSKLPRWIRANGEWWWLRSPGGDSSRATCVSNNGGVLIHGCYINDASIVVRPALKISNLPKLVRGETVEVFCLLAQYIGDDKVLLCDAVEHQRFDGESNDYDESEIKSYLDSWLEEKRKEYAKNTLTLTGSLYEDNPQTDAGISLNAKWIKNDRNKYACSLCGCEVQIIRSPYCPNCGSKMEDIK